MYLGDKDVDRQPNDDNDDDKHTDPNLTYRIKELKDDLFQEHVYRIPLGLIVNLGLVNFAIKTDTKILITLEREMNKLFETNKLAAIPASPDALINFCDHIFLTKN